MEFKSASFNDAKSCDLLVLPYVIQSEKVVPVYDQTISGLEAINEVLSLNDFKANKAELLVVYGSKSQNFERVMLVGLGEVEKVNLEDVRQAYCSVTKKCKKMQWQNLSLALPELPNRGFEELLYAIVEGVVLTNYKVKNSKLKADCKEKLIEKITLFNVDECALNLAKEAQSICEAVHFSRDLANGNADDVTPHFLKCCAEELSQKFPDLQANVLNKDQLKEGGFKLLLAVNQGSNIDPYLIHLKYNGAPESDKHIVLVGKGVTYDTGGLNLKPTGNIETMKCDMSGAAVCLGVMRAVAELKLKLNFSIVIPTTENSISASSYKPGDVYGSYSGKSVEITNTDAEGRLILADALAYASKELKPTKMIDIATLTGAIDIALGVEASGLMSNNDTLAAEIFESGNRVFERVWRMPLYPEYTERLKSDFADLKNWNGRGGSSNVAAAFLQEFVDKDIAWAHLDVASTSYLSEARGYHPKYGTGFGVRLITNFLKGQAKNS